MIWCVEDDASIRDIELYALRSAGLEAEGFTDGAAFWQALQSEKPDLVVLDVMLPGIDGTELLGRMRASTSLRRIPVIMATAKGAEYDRVRALDGGADDYLTKPFSVIELVSRVKFAICFALLALLQDLDTFSKTGALPLRDQILHTKSISKELDYSEENLDSFCDQSWKSPSLSCEGFCSMISLLLG